jgi:hypothetical protein
MRFILSVKVAVDGVLQYSLLPLALPKTLS